VAEDDTAELFAEFETAVGVAIDAKLASLRGVEAATLREVATMPDEVAASPEAAIAIALARELDAARVAVGALATAPVAKELRAVLEGLRTEAQRLAPTKVSPIDALAARRAARRSAPDVLAPTAGGGQ